jgi:beta-galactosidase GanA
VVGESLEPKEGEIDFAYIEEYLDLAAKHGLKSGLLFHLHGAPEWAVAKHKSYWYVDEEGRPFEPSPRPNTPSGGWPGLCPDNKEVQALEERFIAPVVKRFGEHPALAFWEPINEPHMWVDFTKNPNFCFCFCEASRAEFVEWLKVKYKELGAIEEAWGRRISRWEELRPPTWRTSFADWCDWRDFSADRIAFLVARRADLIRRHSPRPVIGHAWGGGAVTCASLGAMAFDDWRNSKALDQWGCSAFPSKFDDSLAPGARHRRTRAGGRGQELWQPRRHRD